MPYYHHTFTPFSQWGIALFSLTEILYTDAQISLHTLLIKYYNDLLGRQSSERGRDEVIYFYVEYANFQEKIVVTLLQ